MASNRPNVKYDLLSSGSKVKSYLFSLIKIVLGKSATYAQVFTKDISVLIAFQLFSADSFSVEKG
jgi:hypothetical protein